MKIQNWSKFQHFKDRRPPWIKLHRDILDQRDIMSISACAFRLLSCLWLLASEDEKMDGNLPPVEDIAFRIRMPVSEILKLLQELVPWVQQYDIEVISDRYQDVPPERERESETEAYKPEEEKEADQARQYIHQVLAFLGELLDQEFHVHMPSVQRNLGNAEADHDAH